MAKRKITNMTPDAARFRFEALSSDIFGGSLKVVRSGMHAELITYPS
jgi:hypothetical protein